MIPGRALLLREALERRSRREVEMELPSVGTSFERRVYRYRIGDLFMLEAPQREVARTRNALPINTIAARMLNRGLRERNPSPRSRRK